MKPSLAKASTRSSINADFLSSDLIDFLDSDRLDLDKWDATRKQVEAAWPGLHRASVIGS